MFKIIFAFLIILPPLNALANSSSPAWEKIDQEVNFFQSKVSQFKSSYSDDYMVIGMILGEGTLAEQKAAISKEIADIKASDRREEMKDILIKARQIKLDKLSGRSGLTLDYQTIKEMRAMLGQEPRLSSKISVVGFYDFLIEWMSYKEKNAAFERKSESILKIEYSPMHSASSEAISERVLNILSSATLIVSQNPDLMPALENFAKEILTQDISRVISDLHSETRYYYSLPYKLRNFIREGTPIVTKKMGNSLIELSPNTSFMNMRSCKGLFSP